jgi:large subunit ribosomal protein L15
MNVSDVNQKIHKHKRPRRLGRGKGTGTGKTAGRGHKGQGQLAGWTTHPAFEGGQMPLARRIPKRGFNNQWARTIVSVNLDVLETLFDAGAEVSPDSLKAKGLLKKRHDELKILATGKLTKKLKVSAHRFSEAARAKIEKAGGEVVVLPGRQPVEKKSRSKQGNSKQGK